MHRSAVHMYTYMDMHMHAHESSACTGLRQADACTYIHAIHIRPYTHTHIHVNIHTSIHTYVRAQVCATLMHASNEAKYADFPDFSMIPNQDGMHIYIYI